MGSGSFWDRLFEQFPRLGLEMLKIMPPGSYFEQFLRLGLEVLKLKLPGPYLSYFRAWAWKCSK